MGKYARASLILSIVGMAGCMSPAAFDSPMAAASGITRADAGKSPREPRIVPMKSMTGDVELLYGDPEIPGQPFVMRIRELPGAIVPPHSHPVDEHITVVQGTKVNGGAPSMKVATAPQASSAGQRIDADEQRGRDNDARAIGAMFVSGQCEVIAAGQAVYVLDYRFLWSESVTIRKHGATYTLETYQSYVPDQK